MKNDVWLAYFIKHQAISSLDFIAQNALKCNLHDSGNQAELEDLIFVYVAGICRVIVFLSKILSNTTPKMRLDSAQKIEAKYYLPIPCIKPVKK